MSQTFGVSSDYLVSQAKGWLGTPYAWGGTSRSGVDCSALVQNIYAAAGIQIPRVTYDQIGVGAAVQMKNLRPGDLVFFDTDAKKSGPDHVGIYIGQGKFIHAPKTGDVVKVSSLTDSYYANRWMGGRRINGVVSSADIGEDVAAQAPEVRLSKSELAERYGASYAFFKSDKELWSLLNDAVEGQWDEKTYTAHLKNSDWWKKNSDSMRKAKVLEKSDPASYRAAIDAATVAVQDAAVKAGAVMSTKEAAGLAKKIVTLGWNNEQIANVMGQYVDFNNQHVLGGQAGAAAEHLQKLAYENGVQVTDQSMKNQAALLTRGLVSMEQLQQQIRQQAAGAFPAYADQLNAGLSMRDIAAPYIALVSQELGLPETDIDVNHPKVKAALTRADSSGKPAPLSLADFRTSLRDDPAWRKTPKAINDVLTIGRQVLADFGLAR